MPRLSLSLLGPFQAFLDEERITTFESNKVRALLVYLAVEADRPHPRDLLAALLWPRRSSRDALCNLRYALYDLRNVLHDRQADPPFLTITHRSLQFNAASDHTLDLATFETTLRSVARNAETASEKLSPSEHLDLHQAVDLYRGAFLCGFSLNDSPAFEEWLLLKREQIDRQMVKALHLLASREEERGDYAEARVHVRRQLALEPWDERAHRHLMHLLALDGRRNAALAHYHLCRSRLAADLGIEPTPRTTALYERIAGTAVGPRVEDAEGDRTRGASYGEGTPFASGLDLAPSKVPFVGREQELAQLHQFLSCALKGRGRVVFVTGEAGSGKTTLMQQFAHQASKAHGSLIVTEGGCRARFGIGDPYLPFREILELLAGDLEPRRAGGTLTRDHVKRLWDMLPLVTQVLLDKSPVLVGRLLSGEQLLVRLQSFAPHRITLHTRLEELIQHEVPSSAPSQGALFEQVTRLLLTLAKSRPVLILLDDLQWIDPGSASLLFHLGRCLAHSPILLIGAYRPGDLSQEKKGERHVLAHVVHELKREFGDAEVSLDRADGREFVDAFLDIEPNLLGEEFRWMLYHHTGGNPLFTVESLRGLQKRGDLIQDDAGQWTEGPALDWEQLPARIEAVVAERIDALPQAWREMLLTASVEGETFTAEVVARVLDRDPTAIVHLLSGPLSKRHRLVRAHSLEWMRPPITSPAPTPSDVSSEGLPPASGLRLSRYRFRHALFQKYLYRSLDDVERPSMHQAVGIALERLCRQAGEEETRVRAAQLASHFEAAGLVNKAIDYLLLAGSRAVELSANDEAIELFTHALKLLESTPPSAERSEREIELDIALATPLLATQGWGAPARGRVCKRAYQLCQSTGRQDRVVEAMFSLADQKRAQGKCDESLDLGKQMLRIAQRSGSRRQLALAHGTLGETQLFRAALDEAHRHFSQALGSYSPYEHRDLTLVTGSTVGVVCLVWDSWVAWLLGHPEQALSRAEEAAALAAETEHVSTMAFALGFGDIGLHFLLRDYEGALARVGELNRVVRDKRLAPMDTWATFFHGWSMTFGDDAPAGLITMQEAMETWRDMGALTGISFQTIVLAEACKRIGQTDDALATLDRAWDLIKKVGERCFAPEMFRLRGELLLARASLGSNREAAGSPSELLRTALDMSRRQGARAWELRSTVSLASVWEEQGKYEQARALVREVYESFDEGFDTPDLTDARLLLERLSDR